MSRIRFEHKTLADGRFHVITSPDVKGFHVSAETREDAEREAIAVLSLIIRERSGDQKPEYLAAVEFQAA